MTNARSCAALFGAVVLSACGNNTPPSPTPAAAVSETSSEWRSLFDGRTTTGWRAYKGTAVPGGWQVFDGSLVRAGDGAGDIITVDRFRDFDLRLEWRVAPGGNSGIFYRATEEGQYVWQSALEMQVLDDAAHRDGQSPLTSAGSLFALYPAPRGVVRPANQWNEARVVMNGNHGEHWLNGTRVLEFDIGNADWNEKIAASKFRTMPLFARSPEGHIGLQDHGDRVEFRNIRIRVLP